ncbi:MAG: hypothetical protein AAFU79_07435 [Myxococcota bacterium]
MSLTSWVAIRYSIQLSILAATFALGLLTFLPLRALVSMVFGWVLVPPSWLTLGVATMLCGAMTLFFFLAGLSFGGHVDRRLFGRRVPPSDAK